MQDLPALGNFLELNMALQLPASKVHLAAVGTRKWLKIDASGATSILQVLIADAAYLVWISLQQLFKYAADHRKT